MRAASTNQGAASVTKSGSTRPGREPEVSVDGVRRRWRWSLIFGGWALVGLMFVGPTYLHFISEGMPVPWSRLISELSGWYLWALLFPLILWAARRFPFERGVLTRRALLHMVLGSTTSVIYALLAVVKNQLILALATGDFQPHLFEMLPGYLLGGFEFYVLIYWAMVAAVHAFDYYGKYRERELRASLLEAQLAQSQLQALRMQLHPHFLFNTLHAISALMHKDVEAADRMISLLSDLLRVSLESSGQQEVPLRKELDILDRYLEIEKVRFGDRLTVRIDVEPQLLDARVPNLLLQPLVENAVRHGVARRSARGRIEVRARQLFPRRLEIQVEDNGPGLPVGRRASIGQGVGLSNTEARLQQLYGSAHRLEVQNSPRGGVLVTVTIPVRSGIRGVAEKVEQNTHRTAVSANSAAPVGNA